jgi:hypothetical protein
LFGSHFAQARAAHATKRARKFEWRFGLQTRNRFRALKQPKGSALYDDERARADFAASRAMTRAHHDGWLEQFELDCATAATASNGTHLQMPRFIRLALPRIVATIEVTHRSGNQFLRRHIVERRHCNADESATHLRNVATTERLHTAGLAEKVFNAVAVELILREVVLALQQSELLGLHGRPPIAGLEADRTIAFASPLAEIEIDFETNCAAMTAAVIRLVHEDGLMKYGREASHAFQTVADRFLPDFETEWMRVSERGGVIRPLHTEFC